MGPPVEKDHCVAAREQRTTVELGGGTLAHQQTAVGGAQRVDFSVAAAKVGCAVGAQSALRLNACASLKFPL